MPEEVTPIVEPVEESQAPAEPVQIPVVEAPAEPVAPAEEPAAPEAEEEAPAPAPAKPAKLKNPVTLSAHLVSLFGLGSDQVDLIEKGEVESTIKANGKELVVGNEEIS